MSDRSDLQSAVVDEILLQQLPVLRLEGNCPCGKRFLPPASYRMFDRKVVAIEFSHHCDNQRHRFDRRHPLWGVALASAFDGYKMPKPWQILHDITTNPNVDGEIISLIADSLGVSVEAK